MKLWLISQTVNNDYDTFDSAVMAAETEEEARTMVPSHFGFEEWGTDRYYQSGWVSNTEEVKVQYIGDAAEGTKKSQIIASFNAG